MQKKRFFYIVPLLFLLVSCGKKETFKDVIVKDVVSNMGKGICDSVLAGAKIDNVIVKHIIPVETEQLIDVTVSFDYEINGIRKNASTVLLYSTKDGKRELDEIGICKYSNKQNNKQ